MASDLINTSTRICELHIAISSAWPKQHHRFWTEFLTSIAAVGCVTSSAITLVVCSPASISSSGRAVDARNQIFFPRSVESELQSRNATREPGSQSRHVRRDSELSDRDTSPSPYPQKRPASVMYSNSEAHSPMTHEYPPLDTEVKSPGLEAPIMGPKASFSPNRRAASGVVIQGTVGLTERALNAHDQRMSTVHPFVHNFTSPIGEYYCSSLNARTVLMANDLHRRPHGWCAADALVREAAVRSPYRVVLLFLSLGGCSHVVRSYFLDTCRCYIRLLLTPHSGLA